VSGVTEAFAGFWLVKVWAAQRARK
jgi:hypothetical protein